MTEYVVCFSGTFFFFLMKNETEKQKFLAGGIEECGVNANNWRFNVSHIWIGANKLDTNQKKSRIVQDNHGEFPLKRDFLFEMGFFVCCFLFLVRNMSFSAHLENLAQANLPCRVSRAG